MKLLVRAHPGEQSEPGDVLVTRELAREHWIISNVSPFLSQILIRTFRATLTMI